MKKFFMFLFVATLATFGFSCSSDDNSTTDDKKEEKQLVLKADKLKIKVGETINFSVEIDNKKIDGVKILINDQPATLQHVFKEEGTFKVVATKEGFKNSNPINVVVEKEAEKVDLKLTLVTDPKDIFANKPFLLTIVSENKPIKDAQLYVDGEALDIFSDEEGEFYLLGPAGTVTFTAEYNGSFSNGVEVTIQEVEEEVAKGEGSFEFNGSTHQIKESYLIYFGLVYEDETEKKVVSRWQIEVGSGELSAVYVFLTPAEKVGENTYNSAYPTADNTTPVIAGVIKNGSTIGMSKENMEFKFEAGLNAKQLFEGKYQGSTGLMNDKPFSIQYDGETYLYDASQNSTNNIRSVSRFANANKKVTSSKIGRSVKELRSYVK